MAFRRVARPPAAPRSATENEFDPSLLDAIPDVPPSATRFEVRRPAEPPEPASAELDALMVALRAESTEMVTRQLARIHASVAHQFADMEARLAQASAEVEALREENARLSLARERYERAFQALKELAADVEAV